MKVLICNSYKVYKTQGGTERISSRVAQGLTALGYQCYLAYKHDNHLDSPETCFVDEINVFQDSLEQFILKNEIDCIIVQKMTRDVKLMYDIRSKHHLSYKTYSVLHFNPGYEEYSATFKSFYSGLLRKSSLKEYVKDLIRTFSYPIYKMFYPLRNKELYRTVYQYSDKVVLLSSSFIDQYANYARIDDKSKFEVIPNALSFDGYLPLDKIQNKKKQVLVVSRLTETPKKISLAIKIWAQIENDPKLADWSFKIVGEGEDRKKYEQMTESLGLKRVCFCGRQNPKPYYEESCLFMMTSAFEGWGLTITEAQQFGCVPLAFDTYSSLHDIIENGENGYIIEKNNVTKYVEKLKELMFNENLRKKMAEQAIASSKRFGLLPVIKQWETLITK